MTTMDDRTLIERAAKDLCDNDVYTLIGHAEFLAMAGKRDMPQYFYQLAERIAHQIGRPELADRCKQLAAASLAQGE